MENLQILNSISSLISLFKHLKSSPNLKCTQSESQQAETFNFSIPFDHKKSPFWMILKSHRASIMWMLKSWLALIVISKSSQLCPLHENCCDEKWTPRGLSPPSSLLKEFIFHKVSRISWESSFLMHISSWYHLVYFFCDFFYSLWLCTMENVWA